MVCDDGCGEGEKVGEARLWFTRTALPESGRRTIGSWLDDGFGSGSGREDGGNDSELGSGSNSADPNEFEQNLDVRLRLWLDDVQARMIGW